MNRNTKRLLIIATTFIIAGVLVFVGALAVLGFDFSKLDTLEYESNTYEISETFDAISIDVETTDIEFVRSTDNVCRIECFEHKKVKHSASVQDGILNIESIDTRRWYDHISITFRDPKVTVYLPTDMYKSLSVDTHTGDLLIPSDFSFESISLSGSTSDVECFASVSGLIKMTTHTGDITLGSLNAGEIVLSATTGNIVMSFVTVNGTIDAETDTGKLTLSDITCASLSTESSTGNTTLKNAVAMSSMSLETDTGDVSFESSDADTITVNTGTGDVTGTLLSEKVFITDTSTGNINTPKTVNGGKCEITTVTGDIDIEISSGR